MKTWYFYLCCCLLIGCSSSDDSELVDNSSSNVSNLEIDNSGETDSIVIGSFISDDHETTGTVTLTSGGAILSFTNFKTDDGPKLLVYLSTDKNSIEYVNLGELKAVSGDFQYAVPENTDINKYKVVSIWCVTFSVSFGHAYLK